MITTATMTLAMILYASSEKLRSEPRHPAAWYQASEMSFRVNSAHLEWKHLAFSRQEYCLEMYARNVLNTL